MKALTLTETLLSYLPVVAFILAAVAIILIIMLFGKIKSILKTIKIMNDRPRVAADPFANRKEPVFDEMRWSALEASLRKLSEKVAELEKEKETPVVVEKEPLPVLGNVDPVVVKEKDVTFFSKFPDLDHGFTEADLSEKQNGEQVYQLILTPESGVGIFYISESPEVQKYALSDVNYYLPKGCNFLNQPGKSSKIITTESGTLVKSGAVWIIENKAQIEFV